MPYFNLGVCVLVYVESTELETKIQNQYYILWEELSKKLDKLENCSSL